MLSHERVWAAIDALAARYSLSASGLAKRAGLDSTAFNKSKRQSADGRPRWPSTESLAKIIEATNSSLDELFSLIEGKQPGSVTRPPPTQSSTVPLIGFAQAGAGGFFDDAGFPAGQGWDLIELPAAAGEGSYALAGAGRFHAAALPPRRHAGRAAQRHRAQGRPRGGEDDFRRGDGQGARAAHARRRSSSSRSIPTIRNGGSPQARSNGWRASSGRASRRRCACGSMRALILPAAALALAGAVVLVGGRMVDGPTGMEPVTIDKPDAEAIAAARAPAASPTVPANPLREAASARFPMPKRRRPKRPCHRLRRRNLLRRRMPSRPPNPLARRGWSRRTVIAPPELAAGEELLREAPRDPLSELSLALPPRARR